MDYEGQKLAELLFYWIIISFGGVGWIFGYFQQDFFVVVQAWFVGVVISVIVSTDLCYKRQRESILSSAMLMDRVDRNASKKYLISQPSLFCLPPVAVMCTRLAFLQPKSHPLARVCSGSTTKGILIRPLKRRGGLQG
jgi:hypothetical protein